MFDFLGRGAEEVITLGRDSVKVYGSGDAAGRKPVRRDAEYLRHRVANHTHY
jgi:hypothetical protein